MSQKQVPQAVDPAVQAARITRTGAIVGVVLAALITGTATGVAAYFTGRKDGVQAAATTVTSVSTETVYLTGGGTRPSTGGGTLLDLDVVDGNGEWYSGRQDVNAETYEQAISIGTASCGIPYSRTYQLDRAHRTFRAKVGLADNSSDGSSVEFRVLVDNRQVSGAAKRVGVGAVENVEADVTDALRLTLQVYWTPNPSGCDARAHAEAVWIEPTLG